MDPLPPKTNSSDETSHSVSYVTHAVLPSSLGDRDRDDGADREEEEILPVDMDLEVVLTLSVT